MLGLAGPAVRHLFAWASSLYELLTGRLPFGGDRRDMEDAILEASRSGLHGCARIFLASSSESV